MDSFIHHLGNALVALRNDPFLNGLVFVLVWAALLLYVAAMGLFLMVTSHFKKKRCRRCWGKLMLAVNVPNSHRTPSKVPVRCSGCGDLTWRENGADLHGIPWERK